MTAPTPPAARDAGVGELLPCPFCGGMAARRSWLRGNWVECLTCRAKTEVSDTVAVNGPTAEAEVIAAWNRRAPTPPAVAS